MKQQISPKKEAATWNEKVCVGDTVEYRWFPEAEPETFTTRTPAEVLSGHTAVVWLNGKCGRVCVEACRPVGGTHRYTNNPLLAGNSEVNVTL